MELLLKIWDSVELEDLKCVLGEFGQWFLATENDIKAITKQEETKNVFANDTFETGYKDQGIESGATIAKNTNFDMGDMRPGSALLREFGLPVPIDFDSFSAKGLKLESQHSKG